MTSPDLVGYQSLTFVDRTASDLVDRALTDAETKLPEATFGPAHQLTVLLEALALIVSEVDYRVDGIPEAVFQKVLERFGVTRLDGTPATATATVTFTTAGVGNLPAGSVLQVTVGEDVIQFSTDANAAPTPGATTATVAITAVANGVAGNGILSGTPLTLTSAADGVTGVQLASTSAGGSDAESDDEWAARGAQKFARLTSTLVQADQFTAAALDETTVFRAFTIDDYDGTATNAGHVTVAVLGPGAVALSSSDKTTLQTTLAGQAAANLAVHVVDPTITAVDVTATVKALAGADSASVTSAVQAVLADYLSPTSWAWGSTVRVNELIAKLDSADGVDYVVSITAPAADVTLPGAAPLANLGTLTLTVS